MIEIQCGIEKLRAEEITLLTLENRYEWGKELVGLGADYWEFERGFPENISINIRHFLDAHREINTLTPVRHLSFGAVNDEAVAKLAAMPVCRQLHTLKLGSTVGHHPDWEFGLTGIRALSASPHLESLRRLELHSEHIGVAGANVIKDAPVFKGLQALHLDDPVFNRKGHNSLRALASAPNLSGLKFLQVGSRSAEGRVLHELQQHRESSMER